MLHCHKTNNEINNDFSGRKNLLLVPDSFFWVTARIANAIKDSLDPSCFRPIICSEPVLADLLRSDKKILEMVDIVHFLTPHAATRMKNVFYDHSAFISTIHHIENEASIEPAGYSDTIMTVSRQWHDELINLGVSNQKLVMIQNGIDADVFFPVDVARKNVLREKFGLPKDAFVVGFSAKKTSDSCDRKGVDVLSKLINSSVDQNKKLFWFIRGPGWNDLIDEIKSQGGRVKYCPFLLQDEDLAESYQTLDAFVITSRIEGGPVPLLEAMACGVPVVTTSVGIVPEILKNGENGFVVDFDSPSQILERLSDIQSDPTKVKKVVSNARRTILDKWQWKDTVKNCEDLYTEAMINFDNRYHAADAEERGLNNESAIIEDLKKWISVKEHQHFARLLYRQKAYAPAVKLANKTISLAGCEFDILREMLSLSVKGKFLNVLSRQ